MTCCFFIIQTSDRIFFFFALFKPIILPFCSILQDKLHSFKYYIQDDRSTRFFCTTNYSIDHIIKRFHEANSMPRLFSQKNLVLCDMQGNNYGLLVKTIKKFPKSPFRPAGRVLTFDKTKFARLNIENLLCLGFISLYLSKCLWFCYL